MNIFLNISNKLNIIMFSSLYGNEGGSLQVNCESKCQPHQIHSILSNDVGDQTNTLKKL